ncbi:MAG: hypothetical protein ACLPT4_00375 [Verrucomicrobiia bacterium]
MNLENLRKAMQILIVDDSPDDVELFRLALLEGFGERCGSMSTKSSRCSSTL